MRISGLLVLILFCVFQSTALANTVKNNTEKLVFFISNLPNTNLNSIADTLPKTNDVSVIVPFEYKQSSLNYTATFRLMDSVALILNEDDSITFSIEGYSYMDEGNDFVCYWLSYNRALVVKTYLIGRGVDSTRLLTMDAKSKDRSILRKEKNEPVLFNCTAEIVLKYPIPPPYVAIQDADEDGIADDKDSCIYEFGHASLNGCPDKNAIIVPFEPGQSALLFATYRVLDSVVTILRKDRTITFSIAGHAYKEEGVQSLCDQLAGERADMVRKYLLSRQIAPIRITSIKNFGKLKPINAGRNPWEKAMNSRVEIFLFPPQEN